MTLTCNIELSTKYRPFSILGLELDRNTVKNMHKSFLSLEKYAGVILLRPEYAGVSSGVEKIAPDFCRSKKIYSGRSSVWSPLVFTNQTDALNRKATKNFSKFFQV